MLMWNCHPNGNCSFSFVTYGISHVLWWCDVLHFPIIDSSRQPYETGKLMIWDIGLGFAKYCRGRTWGKAQHFSVIMSGSAFGNCVKILSGIFTTYLKGIGWTLAFSSRVSSFLSHQRFLFFRTARSSSKPFIEMNFICHTKASLVINLLLFFN